MKEQARYPQETIDKVRELAVDEMLPDPEIGDALAMTAGVVQKIRTRNNIPSGADLLRKHNDKITIEAWDKNNSINEAAEALGVSRPSMLSRLRYMARMGTITDHEKLAPKGRGGNRENSGGKQTVKSAARKVNQAAIDKSKAFLASLHAKRMANVNAWGAL